MIIERITYQATVQTKEEAAKYKEETVERLRKDGWVINQTYVSSNYDFSTSVPGVDRPANEFNVTIDGVRNI